MTKLIDLPFRDWLDNVSLGALSTRETVQASYDIARLAIERGVPGDFVECGVFGGAQCAAMARAIMDAPECHPIGRMNRRVHLFDSFAGIPAPGPHDEGWSHPVGTSACNREEVERHMREWGIPDALLVWHPGWFAETVPYLKFAGRAAGSIEQRDAPTAIAVLRLDGDLYSSTKVCLDNLYPLVSPGGWCIIDDFDLPGARKAALECVPGFGPTYFQRSV